MRTRATVLCAVLLACALGYFVPSIASAQSLVAAQTVSSCGNAVYASGTNQSLTQDTTGKLCDSGGGGGGVVSGSVAINDGTTPSQKAAVNAAGQLSTTNASIGASNTTAPTSSTLTGGLAPGGALIPQNVDANGNQQVVGNVASGTTDSGNGVKGAGIYNGTQPTLTAGQRGDLQMDMRSNLRTVINGSTDGTGAGVSQYGNLNGSSASQVGLLVGTYERVFNSATWDRKSAANDAIDVPSGTGVQAVAPAPTSAAAQAYLDNHTTVAAASINISGAHNLFGFSGSSTVTGWFLLYDSLTCGANGTVSPLRAYAYPTANTTVLISTGFGAKRFGTGVSICFSTTGPFTATSSATAFIGADYE